jgi:hypothetical protein
MSDTNLMFSIMRVAPWIVMESIVARTDDGPDERGARPGVKGTAGDASTLTATPVPLFDCPFIGPAGLWLHPAATIVIAAIKQTVLFMDPPKDSVIFGE